MKLFDLSFRHKIPLWGGALILITAVAISISFGFQAYDDMKLDMIHNSKTLGQTMAKTLMPAILHDDVWRAYEIINAPYQHAYIAEYPDPFHAETMIVTDNKQQVFVSSQPKRYPILADLKQFGKEFSQLEGIISQVTDDSPIIVNLPDANIILIAFPIIADGVIFGNLIMLHSTNLYWPRFLKLAEQAGLITLLVLAVLLPINWYWGQRMAIPLISLVERLTTIREHKLPQNLKLEIYTYNDELGRMFKAFNSMLEQLREKDFLEKQMLQSERMAAIGHLTASIAHEINNPLAGMLMSIDTLKHHGTLDARTAKTVSLLERGLQQIKETVAALLVEARLKNRNLNPQDVDDIYTLVTPQAQKHYTRIELYNEISGDILLPSTLIRQIMINLTLNAVQAAGDHGLITLHISCDQHQLEIKVSNNGKQITDEQMPYLFEPFNRLSETGHGIGLWVTYQIVHQLHGQISAQSNEGITCFEAKIPIQVEI